MTKPYDDAAETLDTTLEFTAHDTEVILDDGDNLDTVQEAALPFDDLDATQLTQITGGMRWQDFRRSTNVEDRRTPAGKARDQAWWENMEGASSPPTAKGSEPFALP